MSRVNNPSRNRNRSGDHGHQDRQQHNEDQARRLRNGVIRSRSRSRSRNRTNSNSNNSNRNNANDSNVSRSRINCNASDGSRRHHGRDLQLATGNLVDKRIEEYPGQGLAKVDDKLYCQPCEKFINHKATTVKRHLGMLYISILRFVFVSFFFVSLD